jgi:adenylosuccinate lyase
MDLFDSISPIDFRHYGRNENIKEELAPYLSETANDLMGKLAGAVGAYNAQSVLVEDPVAFERLVLSKLGLKPSPISSQVVEAEFMTDFIHAIISAFGVVANIADDMRNLQRSEIGEVREFFDDEQVGSSTIHWDCRQKG